MQGGVEHYDQVGRGAANRWFIIHVRPVSEDQGQPLSASNRNARDVAGKKKEGRKNKKEKRKKESTE